MYDNPQWLGGEDPKMTGILIGFLMLIPILLLMALGVFAPFLALGLLFWRWHRENRFRDLGDGRDGTQMLGMMGF